MATCSQQMNVERYFDGASPDAAAVQAHISACADCRAHLAGLQRMRAGIAARTAAPEIADAQLSAFMRELHGRVETAPAPAHPFRFWATVSAVAAALVVTFSIMSITSPGQKPIEATVIEERSSEIEGATTSVSVSNDGTTTVWVNVPEGDMW